ncbi:MAG: PAS-domain containing protein, partial [Paracoccaceae bacterium]
GIVIDALSLRAQEAEIRDLRQILAAVPIPIWRANADEDIVWANDVYLKLATEITGEEDLVWPLPKLMHGVQAAGTVRRVKLESDRAKSDVWFDRHVVASGAETLQFAIPSGATVKAEAALRDFLQTLTKTFAHLSVGLAIFDKNRQLGLFNPALNDLTTLSFEFLSGRPTLFSFLDHLREARILPEPKNYASWRQEMAELERAATSGLYEETWALPSGQTFRVTGRPHPDGAVAFVFEDISAEMSLNRRYRAQIELGHSVLDTQQDALCVFSANGDLVMSNSSYADLWGSDPSTSLSNLTVLDATRSWQEQCKPTPIWGDIRDFVADLRDRADWDAGVITNTGQRMNCTVRPLTAGATLVSFHVQRPEKPTCHSVRRVRHRSSAQGLH